MAARCTNLIHYLRAPGATTEKARQNAHKLLSGRQAAHILPDDSFYSCCESSAPVLSLTGFINNNASNFLGLRKSASIRIIAALLRRTRLHAGTGYTDEFYGIRYKNLPVLLIRRHAEKDVQSKEKKDFSISREVTRYRDFIGAQRCGRSLNAGVKDSVKLRRKGRIHDRHDVLSPVSAITSAGILVGLII
jgi:hypothetical protein